MPITSTLQEVAMKTSSSPSSSSAAMFHNNRASFQQLRNHSQSQESFTSSSFQVDPTTKFQALGKLMSQQFLTITEIYKYMIIFLKLFFIFQNYL